jgi:hypothetical protein
VPSPLSSVITEGKGKKVKLSLCLSSRALCHEDIWGSGGRAPNFLTTALDGGEWSASRPCRFTHGAHWIGGWVSPRVSLDTLKKRRILHCQEPNPGRLARAMTGTEGADKNVFINIFPCLSRKPSNGVWEGGIINQIHAPDLYLKGNTFSTHSENTNF